MLQPSLGVSSLDLGRPPGRPLFVCVVGRSRISPEFVKEVAKWLSGAGVTLFFADTTGAVRTTRWGLPRQPWREALHRNK